MLGMRGTGSFTSEWMIHLDFRVGVLGFGVWSFEFW
jgi:hypothetical protein